MSRRKLLLADDSITIQKVVNLTFADEGVDVVTVGDGDAALAELSSNLPDILLADVNMPGPTGYEICEQLRTNESTRNLPVILLVGSFEPFDEAEASRVGANAYLTKPFQSIKQLISQVNELIEAATPMADEQPPEEAPVDRERIDDSAAPAEVLSEISVPEPASGTDGRPAHESVETVEAPPRYFDDLGYATTVPPVEPTAQPGSAPDDIDSLYTESISSGENELSDFGIDDEIIETSYTADAANNDLEDFASQVATDSGTYEPTPDAAPAVETSRAADSASDAAVEAEQRFADDPSRFENTIAYENWQPADMRTEEGVSTEVLQSLETTKLDGSFPLAAEHPAPAPSVGEDTIRMENRFDTTGSASYQFDDVNLLDLTNNSETPVEITSPANAVEQGSAKQVVTLSPELIEMIAQRVVEKLSEKY